MGHKVHPTGFRLGNSVAWKSSWFAAKSFKENLVEDIKIRHTINSSFTKRAGISSIYIERFTKKLRVTISAVRPGILVGKQGSDINRVKAKIQLFISKDCELQVFISDIKSPETDAKVIADNISQQISSRSTPYKRAMKRAIASAMIAGAKGIKVACSGRLSGAEIARTEWYKQGRVPLHTIRAAIDYAFSISHTTYGVIGVKVWVYKDDVVI